MDLRNSFDALDPRNPEFIELNSDSELDSVPDDVRDDAHADRRDAMEVDEGIDNNGYADQQNAMDVECPFSYFARHLDNCSLLGDIEARIDEVKLEERRCNCAKVRRKKIQPLQMLEKSRNAVFFQ